MSHFKLHSDYDRDGRVSHSPAEYRARASQPGAILVANLDADSRRLPSRVSPRIPVTLDHVRTRKSTADTDLLSFTVRRITVPPSSHQYALQIDGVASGQMTFISNRRKLSALTSGSLSGHMGLSAGVSQTIHLECATLAGAPPTRSQSMATSRLGVPPVTVGQVTVKLLESDAAQNVSVTDTGLVQLAPLILIGNTAEPRIMWLCESPPSGRVFLRAPVFAPGDLDIPDDPFSVLEGAEDLDTDDPLAGLPEDDEDSEAVAGAGNRGGRPARQIPATEPENKPSIDDVQRALQGTGVSFQLIPEAVNNGDCWIQDQMQIGYCQGPSGWMYVSLHLPRQQSNAGGTQSGRNLSGFVTSHLPSQNFGVFNDFWSRTFEFRDGQGNPVQVPFARTFPILKTLHRLIGLYFWAKDQVKEFAERKVKFPNDPSTIVELIQRLDLMIDLARKELDHARGQTTSQDLKDLIKMVKDMLDERHRAVTSSVSRQNSNVELTVDDSALSGSTSTRYRLPTQTIDDLFAKLEQLHSSQNYGGNIEVGPPSRQAPFGKLVVGNTMGFQSRETLMDVNLIRFLESQHMQPLVEIDTEWLHVGHVDEMVSFVPKGQSGNAILRASPGLAMDILIAASDRYLAGLPAAHDHRIPFDGIRGFLPRTMMYGTSPVTHMLRGREWLHHHPHGAVDITLPPNLYRRMVRDNARWGFTRHNLPLDLGPGDDRRYAANLSVWEFLYYEHGAFANQPELYTADDIPHHRLPSDLDVDLTRSTNYHIENEFLLPAHGTLSSEFSGTDIFCLPVLFDPVVDARELGRRSKTSAFTPDMVNLQVIGNRLLMPRPFGPRMKPEDALFVTRRVATDRIRARLTRQLIDRRRLNKLEIWMEPPLSISRLAQWFRDGRPDKTLAQVRTAIRDANRRHFDGRGELRQNWRKLTIPEDTVDLFELYAEAVAAELGLRIRWVDSWFYHIRFGEIHCGSNVLRRPRVGRRNAWWRHFPVSGNGNSI